MTNQQMFLAPILLAALQAAGGPVAINTYGRLENLVTFGDSYTDEGRFDYFVQNHKAPPLGKMLPPSNDTASGGAAWGRFVANWTGASYYNYAVSGAFCTDNVDSRNLSAINGPFPSVLEYEIPVFEQDVHDDDLYPNRRSDNTLYALWIGTNDVGIVGFLNDKNKDDTTIPTTYVDCIWDTFDHIYNTGGRHFVLLNQAPLEHAPMYATPGQGGTGNYEYWNNKTAYNVEQYANKIKEYTMSVNTMYDYGVPFHLKVKQRWPGATFAIFDIHSLMMDVIERPGDYLDEPANVTSPYRICIDGCVESEEPKSSFMWYDELHPSERMEVIFAKHFIEVIRGRSKYGTYYR